MRPRYENAETLREERRIADAVAAAKGLVAHKLPMQYRIDFALTDKAGNVAAFMEAKQRFHKLGKYRDTFVSSSKLIAAKQLYDTLRKGTVFAVEFFPEGRGGEPDEIRYHWFKMTKRHYRVYMGGRKDRDDPQDIEPVIGIPNEEWVLLS